MENHHIFKQAKTGESHPLSHQGFNVFSFSLMFDYNELNKRLTTADCVLTLQRGTTLAGVSVM